MGQKGFICTIFFTFVGIASFFSYSPFLALLRYVLTFKEIPSEMGEFLYSELLGFVSHSSSENSAKTT